MGDDPSAEDSNGGGMQFFLYLFVVHPVCRWILTPKRFPKNKALLYAIGFLGLIASAELYLEYFQNKTPNFYSALGASRADTSKATIKKAYREMSLKYHPDKWTSASAEEQQAAEATFNTVREAYEVLGNDQTRKAYDKHGMQGVRISLDPSTNLAESETSLMMNMGVFYGIWAVLTYFLTMGEASSVSRQYAYTGLLLVLVFEFCMRFANYDFLVSVVPYTTPFEKSEILHHLYPAFMSGCRIIAQATFVDKEAKRDALLQQLCQTQHDMLNQLRLIMEELQNERPRGGGGSGGSGGGSRAPAAGSGSGTPTAASILRDANPQMARLIQKSAQHKNKATEIANTKSATGIPSWAIMIGIYVLFNYVLR